MTMSAPHKPVVGDQLGGFGEHQRVDDVVQVSPTIDLTCSTSQPVHMLVTWDRIRSICSVDRPRAWNGNCA